MKIIKPKTLSVLTRCFEKERRPYFSVGVLSRYSFSHQMSSEVDLWKFLAVELGKDGSPDAGMAKSQAEYLVTGNAYQAQDSIATTVDVGVQLGGLQKTLRVSGDRFWDGNVSTRPEPFTDVPITWAHAFGGEEFDRNPLGKGLEPTSSEDGSAVYALPNVEYPGNLIESTLDRPEPSCFGPIDFTWPQRFQKAGTYNEAWLTELSPGYAKDMDWSIFNLASEDQQQQEPFSGTESFVIEGMHPEKQRLEGTLPGVTAKCFLTQANGDQDEFREVPMRLTTVWFFPHRETLLLVHHGTHAIETSDASDVRHLVLAAESVDAPKPREHYQEVLRKRLDKDKGPIYSLQDEDLLPANITMASDAAMAEMERLLERDDLLRKHQRVAQERQYQETRAEITALGLDPDEYGPPPFPPDEPPPKLEDLQEFADEKKAELEEQAEQYNKKNVEQTERLRAELESLGFDADEMLGSNEKSVIGPPTYRAEEELQSLRDAVAPYAEMEGIDSVETFLTEQRQMFFDNEEHMREGYRQMAHTQTAVSRLSGESAAAGRASVLDRLSNGQDLERADMTGFDLSGLDLSGCDLSGAWLENANLTGTNLDGAKLVGAVLARADLTDAQLNDADLSQANLGLAQFVRTAVNRTNLTEAILAKANLVQASFKKANLSSADLTELSISSADMSGATITELFMHESNLQGICFAGAILSNSHFIECDLCTVDFSAAHLDGVTFLNTKGDEANFSFANLKNARFVETCSFQKANFRNANLSTVNLRGTLLRDSDFSDALLTGSDLSTADCTKATFDRASARDAMLMHSVFAEAVMTRADLMNAILQDADLTGADLSGANLYQADLANVYQDARTTYAGANLKKSRVHPKRAMTC